MLRSDAHRLFFPRVLACLLAGVALSGCQWVPISVSGKVELAADPTTEEPEAETVTDSDPETHVRAILADREWIRELRDLGEPESSDAPGRRWRHRGLDDLLAGPAEDQDELAAFLDHANPVIASNAAIALARLDDPSALEQLTAAVRDRSLSYPMCRAAAEALGEVSSVSPAPHLNELIEQYGKVSGHGQAAYNPELHADLLRSLAKHKTPDEEDRFRQALTSSSADVRLAGLEAWLQHPDIELPDAAVRLKNDRDDKVRAATFTALARSDHPKAEQYLKIGLRDGLLKVRLAVVAGLGELTSDEAWAMLESAAKDPSDAMRAAAVGALASLEQEMTVLQAAEDESWRVRCEVARALAHMPSREATTVAYRLLDDRSTKVQQAVVNSVGQWSMENSGPVLLAAMSKATYKTRQMAADRLAELWSPASEFFVDAPSDEREECLVGLEQRFRQEFGLGDHEMRAGLQPGASIFDANRPSHAEIASVANQLRLLSDHNASDQLQDSAAESMIALGPQLTRVLQTLVIEHHAVLPETVYRKLLPQVDPAFAALERFDSTDVSARRREAREISQLADEGQFSPLTWMRLAALGARENDVVALQDLLSAIAYDASEISFHLAYVAAGHASADVRRRACEHLRLYPAPRHAYILIPLLTDKSPSVARSAAQALGGLGTVDDLEPLRQALAASDSLLRVDAAHALARLGDETGFAALERFSYSTNEAVRQNVATVMADLADPTFVVHLIRMLDDRQAIARIALDTLPKVVGHDVGQPDDHSTGNPTFEQRCDQWKRWYELQGARTVTRAPSHSGIRVGRLVR